MVLITLGLPHLTFSSLSHLTQDQQTAQWIKTLLSSSSQIPVLIGCQHDNFVKLPCSHEDKGRIEIFIIWISDPFIARIGNRKKWFSAHLPLYLQLINDCKVLYKDHILIVPLLTSWRWHWLLCHRSLYVQLTYAMVWK